MQEDGKPIRPGSTISGGAGLQPGALPISTFRPIRLPLPPAWASTRSPPSLWAGALRVSMRFVMTSPFAVGLDATGPCRRGAHARSSCRKHSDVVTVELAVCGQDGDVEDLRLSDQKMIERSRW